jgi:hypothetical protein
MSGPGRTSPFVARVDRFEREPAISLRRAPGSSKSRMIALSRSANVRPLHARTASSVRLGIGSSGTRSARSRAIGEGAIAPSSASQGEPLERQIAVAGGVWVPARDLVGEERLDMLPADATGSVGMPSLARYPEVESEE